MSQFNKSKKNKKPKYSLEAYNAEIQTGVRTILDSVSIVNSNANIIRAVLNEIRTIKTITDEQRNDFIGALNLLVQNTLRTIEELEVISQEAMDTKPEYFSGNDVKVVEWSMNIQAKVMDSCAWIPELTPIYQGIIDELDNSKKFTLVDPTETIDVTPNEPIEGE